MYRFVSIIQIPTGTKDKGCTMVFVPRSADRQTIKTGRTVDTQWCSKSKSYDL